MNREVFSKYDVMTVGEMSSTTIDHCIRYTNPENHELNMTFNFHHLKVDYPNGEKWAVAPFDFLALKRILSEWQVCEDSIYEYLETKLYLPISFAKKEISVDEATDEDRRYLDLHGDDRVVVVKNYVYLSNAALFQYTESRHRLDKFRFVDFARRK